MKLIRRFVDRYSLARIDRLLAENQQQRAARAALCREMDAMEAERCNQLAQNELVADLRMNAEWKAALDASQEARDSLVKEQKATEARLNLIRADRDDLARGNKRTIDDLHAALEAVRLSEEQLGMERNRNELLREDIEGIHKWLDGMGALRDGAGDRLSVVGRITRLLEERLSHTVPKDEHEGRMASLREAYAVAHEANGDDAKTIETLVLDRDGWKSNATCMLTKDVALQCHLDKTPGYEWTREPADMTERLVWQLERDRDRADHAFYQLTAALMRAVDPDEDHDPDDPAFREQADPWWALRQLEQRLNPLLFSGPYRMLDPMVSRTPLTPAVFRASIAPPDVLEGRWERCLRRWSNKSKRLGYLRVTQVPRTVINPSGCIYYHHSDHEIAYVIEAMAGGKKPTIPVPSEVTEHARRLAKQVVPPMNDGALTQKERNLFVQAYMGVPICDTCKGTHRVGPAISSITCQVCVPGADVPSDRKGER